MKQTLKYLNEKLDELESYKNFQVDALDETNKEIEEIEKLIEELGSK